jgi:hypothetical protein
MEITIEGIIFMMFQAMGESAGSSQFASDEI